MPQKKATKKNKGKPNANKYLQPYDLEKMFYDYFTEVKKNPYKIKDWVGAQGIMITREKERPVTMEGFREFGYKKGVTLKNYFDNVDGNYNEYYTICLRIKDLIRDEQINGGMAGIYNPSITQRLNGLVEKTQTELSGGIDVKQITGMKIK